MDPEEQELQDDYQYQSYSAVIEKALRSFQSSSEWADLISSLGKLTKMVWKKMEMIKRTSAPSQNKNLSWTPNPPDYYTIAVNKLLGAEIVVALQSNLKYSQLPKRLIICKRLAQCLHPALPSGVHLKALETYEVVFKIIGTKWLAKDLFIYSSGLFPFLAHAAMSVRPMLLTLYERYFLPLQRGLLPSLQAFVMALLPGLDEGLEVYDRTDALLGKLSLLVGPQVFYGTLWNSILTNPLVRLPASLFIVTHFDRMATGREQRDMLGSNHQLAMEAISLSLQDSNVLVQRNILEILLFFFPLSTCLDPSEGSIPITQDDIVEIVSAASLTVLRRDMSLNRRLYAWLLGMDIKGGLVGVETGTSTTPEDHTVGYFDKYSRTLLVQALINIMKQNNEDTGSEGVTAFLRPFQIITNLQDKPEIGSRVASDLMLEVVRALYRYCRKTRGEKTMVDSSLTGNQEGSNIKENRNMSEIVKTLNMLISSVSAQYLWDYMSRCFQACLSREMPGDPEALVLSAPPSVSELSTLIIFLVDIIPLELYSEVQMRHLPQMLGRMLQDLQDHMTLLSLPEMTQGLEVCLKLLSKIQMPVANMKTGAESQIRGESGSAVQDVRWQEQEKDGEAEVSGIHTNEEETTELIGEPEQDVESGNTAPPQLQSEDSELGLRASKSKQHLSQERVAVSGEGPGVHPQRDNVWMKGGSVEAMAGCMKDILASFISRYLLSVVEEDKVQEDTGQEDHVQEDTGQEDHVQEDTGQEDYVLEGTGQEDKLQEGTRQEDHVQEDTRQEDKLQEGTRQEDHVQEDTRQEDHVQEGTGQEDKLQEGTGQEDHIQEVTGQENKLQEGTGQEDHIQEVTGQEDKLQEGTGQEDHIQEVTGQEDKLQEGTGQEDHIQEVTGQEDKLQPNTTAAAETFTPSKQNEQHMLGSISPSLGGRESWGAPRMDWGKGLILCSREDISEECCQAFTTVCHLLQECTTFPVYLTEDEIETFYTSMFQKTGNAEGSLPLWLKYLMICCLSEDFRVQHVAISSMLELINYSQSLSLVLEDRIRRYNSSDSNPFSGWLQMVSAPPINPTILKVIGEDTDFYQSVALALWGQLDTEHQEHRTSVVELFYRLHCLAPSPAICEDVICQMLLHRDKMVQLEALHRFSVLWHLTREMPSNWAMLFNCSFDRSLFAVMDTLNSQDGSISAVGRSWLIRALSFNDVIRILEPVLLLLLHPSTQRSSIQNVKQTMTGGSLRGQSSRGWAFSQMSRMSLDTIATDCKTEVSIQSSVTIVDREALWTEVEHIPDIMETVPELPLWDSLRLEDKEEEEEEGRREEEGEEREDSKYAQSDTSGAKLSSESSSLRSTSRQALEHDEAASDVLLGVEYDSGEEESIPSHLQRTDSEHTLGSESLSSDEEDLGLGEESIAHLRLLKQEKEKREAIDSLFRHTLLYLQTHDSTRILFAFSNLETLLKITPSHFVEAACTTSIDTGSSAQLNLIHNLIQRHLQTLEGRSFYGQIQAHSLPHSLLVEFLTCLCLRFLRSYYPCHLNVEPYHLSGNSDVQVKSVEVLFHLMSQLVHVARTQDRRNLDLIRRLLSGCKVQQFVLLSLSISMHIWQRRGEPQGEGLLEEQGGLSEESLVDLGQEQVWREHPLQMELLKLLQVLIVLEHHVWPDRAKRRAPGDQDVFATSPLAREWQTAALFQQSARMMQYVPTQPIPSQGMFVSAAARALHPRYGFATHPPWVALLSSSLPYLGRSLSVIVTPIITQICKNLDNLVKQYKQQCLSDVQSWNVTRENMAPDYPLILVEGLTAIIHYCLLDNRKTPVVPDPVDVRNARNAVLEELPRLLSTMALLWGIIQWEETEERSASAFGCSRNSCTSVYFKSTKLLRQKILEFLNPLTVKFGVQLMTAVGSVWVSRKSRRSRSKNKVLPVASEAQQAIVELVKSLSMLSTDTILQLVKEVVRKSHQIEGEKKLSLFGIPLLQFTYAFIQSVSAASLQENTTALLTVLRDCAQLKLAAQGHFLLLGILNNFVNRLPNLDKRDTEDVKEVTQQILEAVGSIAGSSLEQTSWISRSLEVKVQPQVCLEEEEDLEDEEHHDTMVSLSKPSFYSIQALTLLAEVLAPLLDTVYRDDEKEKSVPLVSRLMDYVFPYLKNHSTYNVPSFRASAQLLSSLSSYTYTKRAWKKQTFQLFMDPLFFCMDTSCTAHWRSIIDHLFTCEKSMFKEFMSMQSSSMKLFPKCEQKAALLKRQAFTMFCGEMDQYHLFIPLIKDSVTGEQCNSRQPWYERLKDNSRVEQMPAVASQIFLIFRVLLLRMSSQHLSSLWPIMVSELIHTFVKLERALLEDQGFLNNLSKVSGGAGCNEGEGTELLFPQGELDMYLSACKFLDAVLCFPPHRIPLFQMYRWAFVPEVDMDSYSGPTNSFIEGEEECKPHVVRILEGLRYRFGELNGSGDSTCSEQLEFPLLTVCTISSITQLVPFFRFLACHFKGPGKDSRPQPVVSYPRHSSDVILRKLEDIIEGEFLEGMDRIPLDNAQ